MSLIEVRQLEKVYRVGVEIIRALNGVDLTIERNDFIAIMGSSGSGKSTLMNMLGCLDRPTSGTYLLNGHDVSRMGATELARVSHGARHHRGCCEHDCGDRRAYGAQVQSAHAV